MTIVQLKPWSGFDPGHQSRVGQACRDISAALADGHWHPRRELVAEIAERNELKPKTVANLLRGMRSYGDIRCDGSQVALSTRWSE